MIKLNFLPEPDKSLSLKRLIFITSSGFSIGSILFWAIYGFITYLNLQVLHEEASNLSQRLAVLRAQNKELRELEESLHRLTKLAQDIELVKSSQIGVARFLADLAAKIPTKVWFKEFALKAQNFQVKGYALSDSDLADLQRALQAISYNRSVELVKSQTVYLFKTFAFDTTTRELFMDVSDPQLQSQFFNLMTSTARNRGLSIFKKPPSQGVLQMVQPTEERKLTRTATLSAESGIFLWTKPESIETKEFELKGEINFAQLKSGAKQE